MAYRIDRGTLRSPRETPQGFLRVDGHASKAGVFEYRNPDGSIRRELRQPQDVFDAASLAEYEGISVTDDHPESMIDASNARKLEVGTVMGPARKDDGDHVAVGFIIKDKAMIAKVRDGKAALSTGYRVDLVETPGVHPVYGKYDAIQTNIRPNHLAVVTLGRAGPTARIRMDAAVYTDSMMGMGDERPSVMTTEDEGHAHLVHCSDGQSGCTSSNSATSDEEYGHSHPWQRDASGMIQIGATNGHTHTVLDLAAVKTDAASCVPTNIVHTGVTMATEKNDKDLLNTAATQLVAAEQRATEAASKLAAETARADAAEGKIGALEVRINALAAERTDAVKLAEKDEEIEKLKTERSDAVATLAGFNERVKAAVAARVALERKAASVMGDKFRMDDLADREILDTVIKKLHGVDVDTARSDEFARGRFDAAVDGYLSCADAIQRIALATPAPTPEKRLDSAPVHQVRDAWKQPLPSSARKDK